MGLHTLGELTRKIYEHPLVVSNASLQAALGITKIHRDMKDIVLATHPYQIEFTLKVIHENENEVYQHLDTVKENILGESGIALERESRILFENWKPIREEVIHLFQTGHQQEAISITQSKGAKHVVKLESKMQELTSYARHKADSFYELTKIRQASLEDTTLILTLSGVFISIIISFIAIRLTMKAENLLRAKRNKLQKALDEIQVLQGILPICMHCKGIRDDEGSWTQLEKYISDHSDVQFSHGICESCLKEHSPDIED